MITPDDKVVKHHVELVSGTDRFELTLADGARSIQESSQTASTLVYNKQGTRHGDWEPSYSNLEQRSWQGGRGQEDFSEDNTKYYGGNCWSLTANKLLPPLLVKYATGIRVVDEYLPTLNCEWKDLYGTQRYTSTPFVCATSGNKAKVYMWLRRIGDPAPLTLTLFADTAGEPSGSALKTVTVTRDNCPGLEMSCVEFAFPTVYAATATNTYHIKLTAAAGDNSASHWTCAAGILDNDAYLGTLTSAAGSTWISNRWKLFYRVVEAAISQLMRFFTLEGQLYVVNQRDDGTASVVYMNGDRGDADSNAGALTTLVDATKTGWVLNEWTGWRVKIIAGPGLGEERTILSNTTAGTATVDNAWYTAHTTATRYIIYGGKKWSLVTIGTTALSAVVTGVTVYKKQAHFAQGAAANALKVSTSGNAHTGAADGSNKADLIHAFDDPEKGARVVRGLFADSTIAFGNQSAVGANTTFETAIAIGDSDMRLTTLSNFDNGVMVHKEDRLFQVKSNKPSEIPIGIHAVPGITNGNFVCANNLFYYFNWSRSLEQLYGATCSDVGLWRGAGLPQGYDGPGTSGDQAYSWIFQGVDAGPYGTSGVYCYDGVGWHPIYIAPRPGMRVRGVKFQSVEGGNPLLWICVDGELVYLTFPANGKNPSKDDSIAYGIEGIVESSSMDMGMAQLPKFFKELELLLEKEVECDTYLDVMFNDGAYYQASTFTGLDVLKARIGVGDKRKMRYRIRIYPKRLLQPPVITCAILKCFGRAPTAKQWTLKIRAGGVKYNGQLIKADELAKLYNWTWDECQRARGVRVYSIFRGLHGATVVAEPPTWQIEWSNQIMRMWGGSIYLTLREV